MSLQFLLPNGDVGSYPWGSNLVQFTPKAPVDTKSLWKSLAAFLTFVGSWNTNVSFRESIALQHEVVHYLQDLLTGVGHWDYLVRRHYYPRLLTNARVDSYIPEVTFPYKTGEAQSIFEKMQDELVMRPSAEIPETRRKLLASTLTSLNVRHLRPENSQVEEAFLIQSILEAEAVATVALQISQLGVSPFQAEIANQGKELFIPFHMKNPHYAELIWILRDSIDAMMGSDFKGNIKGYEQMIYRLLIFFADLACAFPTPDMLANGPLTRADFEPGTRLARMFDTFLFLDETETEEFLMAASVKGDVVRAEAILLKRSSVDYPSYTETYSAWLGLFSRMMDEDDNRILRLRYNSCKSRLDNPGSCAHKSLLHLHAHRTPIFFLRPTGINANWFTPEFLDSEELRITGHDLLANNRDIATVDFFYKTGRFICPYAHAQVCQAMVPTCASGHLALEQLPKSPDCLVRAAWRDVGWPLRDEW